LTTRVQENPKVLNKNFLYQLKLESLPLRPSVDAEYAANFLKRKA